MEMYQYNVKEIGKIINTADQRTIGRSVFFHVTSERVGEKATGVN